MMLPLVTVLESHNFSFLGIGFSFGASGQHETGTGHECECPGWCAADVAAAGSAGLVLHSALLFTRMFAPIIILQVSINRLVFDVKGP